jgi:hypothetical protein
VDRFVSLFVFSFCTSAFARAIEPHYFCFYWLHALRMPKEDFIC